MGLEDHVVFGRPGARQVQHVMGRRPRDLTIASAIACCMFALFNANGREIPSYDSQPAKYSAIELARRGTLRLNYVVGRTPELAARPAFVVDRAGNYRSAYPVASALAAGAVAWVLSATRLIDLDAPLAPALVAKVTASLLAAIAVALAFLGARRRLPARYAFWVAIGLGLGTNMWASVSQTLWQQETALLALIGAVSMLGRLSLTTFDAVTSATLLGIAGAARPQLAPTVSVLAISIVARLGVRWRSVLALLPIVAAVAAVMGLNIWWFGHPLGPVLRLEAMHGSVHRVGGTFSTDIWDGMLGLLASPNRGLLVFSPIALVAVGSARALIREGWKSDLRWCGVAVAVQLLFYASYAVWWGGHTYGPRYALDALPTLIPLASTGLLAVVARTPLIFAGLAALTWSVAVAATGAFEYPAGQWNSLPLDVDRHHERLWDWSDPQVLRCWRAGPSPQNFALFSRAAFRDASPGDGR